ncbi:MAG TPA: tRNA lysidine(34) synthetase TilS [Bacteroidales bacterium]|nr:tRNA lysidine(34) synthetase TilS [Bacteroidales bacterium]
MLAEFHSFISENNLAKPGSRILLAVSGGIDSMVMADLFRHLPYEIAIAHCNFSLRGLESEGDEDFVREYCSTHNIIFYTKRFDTKRVAEEKGISIQMAARDLRYEWFESIRQDGKYESIAIAHNLNDKIETVLINLTRGTGLSGLTGIKTSSNSIIRPLLFATREKIAEYSKTNNIRFREDRSNAETKYTRNKIRHLVIPVLKEINPSIEQTLNEESERFSDINCIVSEFIESIRKKISSPSGNLVSFNIPDLKDLSKNKTVLFELFRLYGLNGENIGDLVNIIEGRTGSSIITNTHRLIRNRKEILVSPLTDYDTTEKTFNSIDELSASIEFKIIITDINNSFVIPSDSNIACLDSAKIKFPLTLRNWEPGDQFYPLGMDHPKKLSDYFIDRKYSVFQKEGKKVVIESDGKIIWIVGDRIDNRFRITVETRKALIITAR